MSKKKVIAVFDFDHTITDCDSLMEFLKRTQGLWRVVSVWSGMLIDCIAFFMNRESRQKLKEKVLRKFLGGMKEEELMKQGLAFSRKELEVCVKKKAMERILWHKRQGHLLILISASLDFYLADWAERHGFDHLICSKLVIDQNGKVTGKLVGKNCWGPEKARRLRELLGDQLNNELYVYGDSRGDAEILALADHPYYRRF